jgi:hypothetical protein
VRAESLLAESSWRTVRQVVSGSASRAGHLLLSNASSCGPTASCPWVWVQKALLLLCGCSFSPLSHTHNTPPSPPRDFPAEWEHYDVGDDDDDGEDDEWLLLLASFCLFSFWCLMPKGEKRLYPSEFLESRWAWVPLKTYLDIWMYVRLCVYCLSRIWTKLVCNNLFMDDAMLWLWTYCLSLFI